MQFINKTSLSNVEFLLLIAKIPTTTSLLDLMVWSKKKNAAVLDVIKLDEYTFDVIISWDNNLFLIPDVT
jgi:hypothetical protein